MICCCCVCGFDGGNSEDGLLFPNHPVEGYPYHVSIQQDGILSATHRLVKHRVFLQERMDVEFGLMDELLSRGVLSMQEFHKVNSKGTPEKKVGKVIDYIVKKNLFDDLRSVLNETKQEHLANFINSDGVYREDYGGDWPIKPEHVRNMDINRRSLVELIDPSELTTELYAKGAISNRHREFINAKNTTFEKSGVLLDITRRFSLNDFRIFQDCLDNTGQSRIKQVLTSEGEVVRVHTDLNGLKQKVSETETELVKRITYLLRNETVGDARLILDLVHLGLIGATTGHSIVLHFLCKTVDELNALKNSLRYGNVKRAVGASFRALSPNKDAGEVRVKKFERDGDFLRRPFRGDGLGRRRKRYSGDIPPHVLFRILGYAGSQSF